jgi:hypothetical protein
MLEVSDPQFSRFPAHGLGVRLTSRKTLGCRLPGDRSRCLPAKFLAALTWRPAGDVEPGMALGLL